MTIPCFPNHFRTLALAVVVAGAVLSADPVGAAQTQVEKVGRMGSLASLWSVPRAGGAAWLVQPGSTHQIKTAFRGDTIVSGTCQRHHGMLRFKVSDSGRPCRQCGAGSSQAACIAGKPLAAATVEALLRALPIGTGLRVAYNVADKPESGLRSVTIDRRSVLLRVSGLQHLTPPQLDALVGPLGANHAVLLADGKELRIDLKQEWTAGREAQFEKRLARVGGKLAYTVPECCRLAPR